MLWLGLLLADGVLWLLRLGVLTLRDGVLLLRLGAL